MAVNCYVMAATTFTKSGELDEAAFRLSLRRIIAAGVGIFLGSGGGGEGHALEPAELRRIYEIGVEECAGKVSVQANLPDEHTAAATLEQARLALDAGVDVVHLCTLEGRHGMHPTAEELTAYYDDLLAVIKRPVALAVNRQVAGYAPRPRVLAAICRRYSQVVALRISTGTLVGPHDDYVMELRHGIGRDIDCYVQLPASLNALTMGANGVFGAEANLIPQTFRRYVDCYNTGALNDMARAYQELMRFNACAKRWSESSTPRWVKMAMRIFKLPGWEGGLRRPYLMPSDETIEQFKRELLALNLPEINELARAAGLVAS
jgi:4-hydroxy-tetrahydrodipicolinate synthase